MNKWTWLTCWINTVDGRPPESQEFFNSNENIQQNELNVFLLMAKVLGAFSKLVKRQLELNKINSWTLELWPFSLIYSKQFIWTV